LFVVDDDGGERHWGASRTGDCGRGGDRHISRSIRGRRVRCQWDAAKFAIGIGATRWMRKPRWTCEDARRSIEFY
jgi:hypothetical protein